MKAALTKEKRHTHTDQPHMFLYRVPVRCCPDPPHPCTLEYLVVGRRGREKHINSLIGCAPFEKRVQVGRGDGERWRADHFLASPPRKGEQCIVSYQLLLAPRISRSTVCAYLDCAHPSADTHTHTVRNKVLVHLKTTKKRRPVHTRTVSAGCETHGEDGLEVVHLLVAEVITWKTHVRAVAIWHATVASTLKAGNHHRFRRFVVIGRLSGAALRRR